MGFVRRSSRGRRPVDLPRPYFRAVLRNSSKRATAVATGVEPLDEDSARAVTEQASPLCCAARRTTRSKAPLPAPPLPTWRTASIRERSKSIRRIRPTHTARGRERRESDRRHDVVHWAASRHRQRDPQSDRERTVHVHNVPVQSRREETISGERERAERDV